MCSGDSASATGNPGPRRGKEDAFEKQIAGRWHIRTLQEASKLRWPQASHESLPPNPSRRLLQSSFNRDTFYPNVDVKSMYLHDTRRDLPDQVMEGEHGWVLQGVLSRAIFRRPPVSGSEIALQCSLYISATSTPRRKASPRSSSSLFVPSWFLKKLTWLQVIFNGTAWRSRSRDNLSTIDEAFMDSYLACAHQAPTAL